MNSLNLSGFVEESTCRSVTAKCTKGSKGPFVIISPALKKTKEAEPASPQHDIVRIGKVQGPVHNALKVGSYWVALRRI